MISVLLTTDPPVYITASEEELGELAAIYKSSIESDAEKSMKSDSNVT